MVKNQTINSSSSSSNANPSTFLYNKVKQEAKIFSNILFILGKVEQDGFFNTIFQNFDKIIESEMFYAVNELKKIQRKSPKFDIKGQLINNTYIYKENLKLLSGMLIDQLWKEKVKEENISEFVSMSSLKGYLKVSDEIKEEDDEEDNYGKESKDSSVNIHNDNNKESNADLEKLHSFDYKFNPQNEISENNENVNSDKEAEDNEQRFVQPNESIEANNHNESSDTWKFKEKNNQNMDKTDENNQYNEISDKSLLQNTNSLQKSLLEKNKNDELDDNCVANKQDEKHKENFNYQVEKGINNANSFQEPNESMNEEDIVFREFKHVDNSVNNNLQSDQFDDMDFNSDGHKIKINKKKSLESEKDPNKIIDNNNGTKEIFESSDNQKIEVNKKEDCVENYESYGPANNNPKLIQNHPTRKFFCGKFNTEETDPDHISISDENSLVEPEVNIIKDNSKNDAKDESNNNNLNKSADILLNKKVEQKALRHPPHEPLNQINSNNLSQNNPNQLPIQFQQLTIQSQHNPVHYIGNSTSLPTTSKNRQIRNVDDLTFSSPQEQKSNYNRQKDNNKNDTGNSDQFIKNDRANNLESNTSNDTEKLRINNMHNLVNYERNLAEQYKMLQNEPVILQLHNNTDYYDDNNNNNHFVNNSSNQSLGNKKYGLNSHKLEELQNNLRKVYKIESLNVKNKKINLKKLLKTHELNFTSPNKGNGKSTNLSASDRHTKPNSSISSQFNNSLNYNNQNFISEVHQNRFEFNNSLKQNKDIFTHPKNLKEKFTLDNSLNIEGNISTRAALSKKLPGTTPVKSKNLSNSRIKNLNKK